MIASHRYQFIFMKTRKTASTSVELALSRHCGPSDIITQVTDEDEAMRRELGGRGPQNVMAPLISYRRQDITALVRRRRRKTAFNHMMPGQLIPMIGKHTWDRYFKFAVVRNPWDAVVSMYFWVYRDASERPAFDRFLESPWVERLAANRDIYSIRGETAVDFVCRFETLSDDLETVRKTLGLPEPLSLPLAKTHTRQDRRPYQEMYRPEDAARIAAMFAQDIADFGYRFDAS